MSSMTDENEDNRPDQPEVNPQAMDIIQTSATQFTQATAQAPGAQQNPGQLIANFSLAISSSPPVTSAPEKISPDKMEEDKVSTEPKILCVICRDEHEPSKIQFACKCTQGRLCDACAPRHFATWKSQALKDRGPATDTGLQVYLVRSHKLNCPNCNSLIAPETFDPAMAWYKAPSFPPSGNVIAVISADSASASMGISFSNGFDQIRYFSNTKTFGIDL